jgi:hypothetical protein
MKRILWTVFWILTATMGCFAQTTFYYPHIVDGILSGDVWRTTILLTNPGPPSSLATGTIMFYQDTTTGANVVNKQPNLAAVPFNISLTDESNKTTVSNSVSFSINGGQTKKYVSAGATPYLGGSATVSTLQGVVTGTAIFSHFDPTGTVLLAEAGVPSAAAVTRQAIFVDTTGGYNIGMAFSNPGNTAASVNLSLLNAAGTTVSPTVETLGPGNHDAFLISTPGPMLGTLQITSATPLAVIALRFDSVFRVFTTLPPVNLASLGSLYPTGLAWLDSHPWLAPFGSVARFLGSLQIGLG